jgi:beta-aspartyl-peptidase (threonine type)
MKPSVIVHGGAWDIPDGEVAAHVDGCRKASQTAKDLLLHGASALDAVETAVTVMEEDPVFDAGVGSVLNQSGQVEMDAIIMDGATLRSGAVAALRHIRNPVRVARRLMEDTPFSMLAGDGALKFALSRGFEECTEEDLLVGRELEDYREYLRTGVLRTREEFAGKPQDTVGACAMDRDGHLACATSTGGTRRKIPGRVGDSPIVGAGAYADDALGAASSTGWGEKIMAVVLAKTSLDLLKDGRDAYMACLGGLEILSRRVDGPGGIIIIDTRGAVGFHHNTPRMAYAFFEGASGDERAGIRR